MHSVFETAPATSATAITFATKATWDAICADLPAQARQFALANGFTAKPGACLALPSADGQIAQVVFGLEEEASKFRDLFRPGQLPGLLPPGVYRFANAPHDVRLAALAFALGSYRFNRYRKTDAPDVRLVPPDGIDVAVITRMAEAVALARDLINTPANDMGPAELAEAAQHLAKRFGANFDCIVGDDLARQNFPLIHAVGMASSRAPRLIDLIWGDPAHPKVTLVGKGVGQHQPAFGVGIADFHAKALARGEDIERPERVAGDRILDRWDQHPQPHLELCIHHHLRQRQHVGGPAHILLHDQHAAGWLEIEPAGVEADALADQRYLGVGRSAPDQINQPGRAR